MKIHSTNYFDTFIEVAEDSKANCGTPPSAKEKKTVAEMQYEMIVQHPYQYTSDDVLFQVFADRNNLAETAYEQAKVQFFSKGQPCFRASPLTKNYGFGVHYDNNGKIALYGVETDEYQKFVKDGKLKKIKAMKSSR
jgi:hypothetical protein